MSTSNLYKHATSSARLLGDELREMLRSIDPAVSAPLLERLRVEARATPQLVLTGQYSAGKSTLIEALTNRAFSVGIGSGVTTDDVTTYDWDGDVQLVDTPGVHAGRPQHDERAEQALQSADLVLFAVTVELFDDVLVAHLRDVLGRLGKSRQTLIVLTKAGTLDAAAGVRETAIKEALGPFAEIPWVECDAQYYLDGLDLIDSEPNEARQFIESSGLDRVAAIINEFARQQGESGRLSQPLQLIVALTFEALASLTDDPEEQAVLTVLARQRSALSKKRIHLDTLLGSRATQFRTDAVRAATQFADRIEQDEQAADGKLADATLDDSLADLNESLRAALERFEDAVRQVLEVQFDDLASEVLEIEASPYGRLTLQLSDPDAGGFEATQIQIQPGRAPLPSAPTWAGDLGSYLKQFHKFWGAGDGVKAAAGGNGHQIVLKVGHAFGKKFKPWEAARAANNIGKVAKVGGAVIAVGLEAYGVFADERAAVKAENARAERRRNITQEVLGQADAIIADALRNVGADLDAIFRPEFQRIDAMASEIHDSRSMRSDLRDRLNSIRSRAEATLADLARDQPAS
jgi:small GTP-binding protein